MHLSGGGGWQVRDVDVEEKGRQDRSLWTPFLKRRNLLRLPFAVVEAASTNHFHDHGDHFSVHLAIVAAYT